MGGAVGEVAFYCDSGRSEAKTRNPGEWGDEPMRMVRRLAPRFRGEDEMHTGDAEWRTVYGCHSRPDGRQTGPAAETQGHRLLPVEYSPDDPDRCRFRRSRLNRADDHGLRVTRSMQLIQTGG